MQAATQLVETKAPEPSSGPELATPARVLVVDDSRTNRSSLAQMLLEHGVAGACLLAADGFEAWKLLRGGDIDIVVCDLNMPRCDGLRFLRLKGMDRALSSVPVIVLTGSDDQERKIMALHAGASDYVTKPFLPTELVARMHVHLRLQRLQRELTRANQELLQMSHTDALTGAKNRRFLMDVLDEELERARRYDRVLSFALFDLDHFKRLNDTWGHLAGDAALVAVAATLQHTLRLHDTVARYGGEEFAAILPETGAETAHIAANRVRRAIEESVIVHAGAKLPVTASCGVASFPHPLVTKTPELISLADAALYEAKRTGRNCVVCAR